MIWFLAVAVLAGIIYWLFLSPYSQIFGKFPYKIKTEHKVVARTFDDGPNEPFTSQIIDYLDSKNIKATFFQVGKCIERYPETTSKIFRSGHTIGIHSFSHRFGTYFSQPTYSAEIERTNALIKKQIGKEPVLFRPPWLWRQPLLFSKLSKLELLAVSGEFCSSIEVFQPSARLIAKHALAKSKPGLILIFHDGYNSKGADREQTVEAVKIVVEELLSKGYKFTTVNDLMGIGAYKS